MHRTAEITMERRNGNLHITIIDSFTMGAAARLVASMDSCDNGQGNIFIHTEKISDIAPEGSRVIVNEHRHGGHGGCGRCRNCKCQEKQAE